MNFNLTNSVHVLEKTPLILEILLSDLPDTWIETNEGPGTWSPYEVVGHLIHGEKTDWIPRARIILEHGPDQPFTPFDRFAQLVDSREKSLDKLLNDFTKLRSENLSTLKSWDLNERQLQLTGTHPDLGVVTLQQLIATWTVHDLGHIHQICRVMAHQYRAEVGPWIQYLGVLNKQAG